MKKLTRRIVSTMISGMLTIGMIGGVPVSTAYAAEGEEEDVAVSTQSDAETENLEIEEVTEGVYQTDDGGVPLTSEYFEDDAFRNYIHDEYDWEGDYYLSKEELEDVSIIDVSDSAVFHNSIWSLKGIEWFPNLVRLECGENIIKELDVSKNTKLHELNCNSNQLSSLDVSNNENLEILNCSNGNTGEEKNNKIKILDLSNNKKLRELNCYDNEITQLILPESESLVEVKCGKNAISSIDVSKNPSLEKLDVENNPLTSIDAHNNENLKVLFCRNGSLEWIDISNTELEYLDYWGTAKINHDGSIGWYVVSGVDNVVTIYSGFRKIDEAGSWYFSNGVLDTTLTGVCECYYPNYYVEKKSWCYLNNGKLDTECNGFVASDGKELFFVNGVVDETKNGLVQGTIDGIDSWYYVKAGVFDSSYNGLVEKDNKLWKVKDGVIDGLANGPYMTNISTMGGKELYSSSYYKNGVLDIMFNGFSKCDYDGDLYYSYYENGLAVDYGFYVGEINGNQSIYAVGFGDYPWGICDLNQSFPYTLPKNDSTGIKLYCPLVHNVDKWYLYKGEVKAGTDTEYKLVKEMDYEFSFIDDDVQQGKEYSYYFVLELGDGTRFTDPNGEMSIVRTDAFTGFKQNGSQWYYYKNGVIDSTANGPINGTINGVKGWYMVENGKANLTYKGFAKVGSSWMYFTNGLVDKTINADHYGSFYGTIDGVGGWYVVKAGKAYPDFSGFALVGSSWMQYKNGQFDKSYTGTLNVNINGTKKWYYINKGKAILDYTGLGKIGSSWMYIKNGDVNKTVTGIITGTVNGTKAKWYVKSGKVQLTYSGTYKKNGKTYTIKKGKVVSVK